MKKPLLRLVVRSGLFSGLVLLFGLVSSACTADQCSDAGPSSEAIASVGAGGGGLPAGFDVWLPGQCPDGRTLRITRKAGAQDTACETVRENLLANACARKQLVDAYTAQTTAGEPSGERTGQAKERWGFTSFFCAMAVNAAISYQCEQQNFGWAECTAAQVAPDILCAVIPLP